MEGLEVSEVNINFLYDKNRIDAETYRPFYLDLENAVTSKPHISLGEISAIIKKGIFDIKASSYSKDGVPFVRISNLRNMGISTEDIIYIPESENNENRDTYLTKGDVILSKTAYAASSIVQIDYCNTSQDTIAVKLKKKISINSPFLVSFLNSKYGHFQMQRWFTGNIQMHLNLNDAKKILIPIFKQEFQQVVSEIIWKSFSLKNSSKTIYKQGEEMLLNIVGLNFFKLSSESTNIKGFKESFGQSGRLDAEYYQKKYEQVIDKIKSVSHASIGELTIIKKSIEPGSSAYSEEGFPFLRVADYNKFGFSKPQVCLSREYYEENKEKIDSLKPKKGTILFTKDGSVGNALMVKDDMDLVTSGAILHLILKDPESVLPEYLTLVLNSDLVQKQAERDAGGSIILHWRVSEIEKVIVPIIDKAKQKEISELITESFTLKKQSEQLLEAAKRAVEIAIEENEETAMKYIEERMEEIGA